MTGSFMEKYCIPVIPTASIKRARLVSLMQSLSNRRILFIHAPAGYGKTTATVQWLAAKNLKAAWFSLDGYEASAANFYRSLLMAFLSCEVSEMNADLIQNTIGNNGFDAFPLEYTLELFTKLNFDEGPSAVVIDDFHLFQDSYVTLSLPVLRSRMPARVRFVILSRNPPEDMLNDYILKETIKQVSFEDLQFNKEEILKLFSKHGIKLSDYDAEKIQNQTIGWPAALSALILFGAESKKTSLYSNNKMNNKIKDNAYLYKYIKNQIYEFWDEETASTLLKTSICEFVSPELCERLTGRQNAWDTILRLSKKTGLAMGYGSESYRYQKLFRDFLTTELESDETIDKKSLYNIACLWYKEKGNITAALDMAVKSGDIPLLEDTVRLNSYEYGRFTIDVESYVQEVERNVLRKLPTEIIEKSPRLCLECCFAVYAMGALEESKKWILSVKKHVAFGTVTQPRDMFMAFFLFATDPEKDPWFMIRLLKQMDLKAEQLPTISLPGKKPLPAFTLTYNMPFYHKAQRDYAEISPSLREYISELSKYLPQVLSPYDELLILLIEGGVLFERYELIKAKECAWRAVKGAEGTTPELIFASLMLLCDIYWAEGNGLELNDLRTKADEMITATNAFYLMNNFNAYVANLSLYNGDVLTAANRLENNVITGKQNFSLYESYQNLTRAKALIVMGHLAKAVDFIQKICEFSQAYRRQVDLIEARTLWAVCLWRMKKYDEAAQTLISAIITAHKYELPMPVVKHGADIVPVLQKLMNRLRMGYDCDRLNKAFVGSLYLSACEFAKRYGGFFAKATIKPIKLSQKQALILKYLSQNLSYREMCELTNTKITTIKDHVTKLYQKLGVNNAADALLKAKEQGIL